jgi:hypothetical protein
MIKIILLSRLVQTSKSSEKALRKFVKVFAKYEQDPSAFFDAKYDRNFSFFKTIGENNFLTAK